MSSAALIAAAVALLCMAGALVLVQYGERRKKRASIERFIDSRMSSAVPSAASGAPAHAPVPGAQPVSLRAAPPGQAVAERRGWRALTAPAALSFAQAMQRSGLSDARLAVPCALTGSLALSVFAGSCAGTGAFCMTLIACAAFLYVLVARRTLQRRHRIVRQLPSFIDGIVRLIVLGNSVPAAFQASLQTTEAPLRPCLDHVSQMLRAGAEIDRALWQAARVYRVRELELVGAVLRLSVKYGGRADVMLDRMASFMRDLEQARRELAAMSAETRLSAWVLTLLPVGIGAFLIASNHRYFAWMWDDASGQRLVYLAFGLQVLGSFLIYRLARLKG